MKKHHLLFVLLLSVSVVAASQFQGGFNFAMGFPQGEFSDNVDRYGYGVSGHFGFYPNNPYLLIGGGIGIQNYGSETKRVPLSTTVSLIDVDMTTTNNLFFGHLLLQAGVPLAFVRPYFEGRFGINYLYTETHIDDIGDGDEIASSTNFDDTAVTYGGGGGLMFQVWQRGKKSKDAEGPDRVYIDIKAMYMPGGEAQYLREGDIEQLDGGEVIYHYSQSTTDMLHIQIGVGVDF